MYGKYVLNGKNSPTKATVHFYISKEEIAKMEKTQKMKCFFHNVNKIKLPFSKVSWSIQH
jgi:phage-related holin